MTASLLRGLPVSVVLPSLVVAGFAWAQPPATPVQVDAVRTAQTAQTVPIVARVVSTEAGPIAARTQGRVDALNVQVGDRVEKGAVIAELDRSIQRTQLAQAKAGYARAEAQAALAKTQLDRLAKLRDSSAFEESLFDQRAGELAVAEADLLRARVDLKAAETDYSWTTIRAPFSGVVVSRSKNTGSWVNRGETVINLLNTDAFEIAADVPAARLSGIATGDAVQVDVAGSSLATTIRAIVPSENPTTRTREVRAAFNRAPSGLSANAAATLLLPVGSTADVLTVHKDAINRNGANTSVYVVEDGKTAVRPVQLGEAVGSRLTILSGLEAGELVVTRGNERLRPGQAVAFEAPEG